MIDLASAAVGGEVVLVNDEFFAPAANLVAPGAPEWREGEFTDRGKWMDGWESRRRRRPGHDWSVVRLGIAGIIRRVLVDTTHFRGNAPEAFGLDGIGDAGLSPDVEWEPLVERRAIEPDTVNPVEVDPVRRCTFVRLRIYPDGGVARLRLLGVALPARPDVAPDDALPDLAGLGLGGRVEAVSDDFFSAPEHVLRPGPSAGMHDGWETRRRRGGAEDAHDWLVVRLGLPGTPRSVMVDTSHFRGNAPGWVSVDAGTGDGDAGWTEIVARRPVEPHRQHLLEASMPVAATRVRLNLYPDGGVARFRVFGTPDAAARRSVRLAYLDALFPPEARRFFRTACAADRFVDEMVDARPFLGTSEVLAAAGSVMDGLEPGDWRQAFAAHPRIGERSSSPLSTREQAGVAASPAEVLEALRQGNLVYEERFGMPFIVRAAGRSGAEMLDLLRERLGHDVATEQQLAAGEQRRITELRLRHMLCMDDE